MKQIMKKFGVWSLLVLVLLFYSFVVGAFAEFDSYSFPDGFFSDDVDSDSDEFMFQIVVGADAEEDLFLARRIVESVNSDSSLTDNGADADEFGDGLVEITYEVDNFDFEDEVDILKKNSDLNYGETIELVSYEDGIGEEETDFLIDDEFESGLSDKDYEQRIRFYNGDFNYALRDDVEGVEEIIDGIYYDSGDVFAVYSIEFESPLDLSDSNDLDEDLIGSSLYIMDLEFVVVSVKSDGADLDELELVGGVDTISLKEGEEREIVVGEVVYDIEVNVVSEDKVFLKVNGEFVFINLYETYNFEDNLSITAIELLDSDRNSVMGSVELIVGGQKVLLRDDYGEVEVNGEGIDDMFEKYDVVSDFSDGQQGMDVIEIIYSVEDEVLLTQGDVLEDVLFNVFEIHYDGLENSELSIFELSVNDEVISIDGVLFNGESFDRELIYTNTTDGVDGVTYLQGKRDDNRVFFKGSDVGLFLPVGFSQVSGSEVLINFSNNDIDGNGFLMSEDVDEQYLYEITDADPSEGLIDIEEIFDGDIDEELEASDFISDVNVDLSNAVADDENRTLQLDFDEFNSPIIAFENDLIMNLSQVESVGVSGLIRFYLDENDVDSDDDVDKDESYDVVLSWDDSEDEFDFLIDGNDVDFVNSRVADVSDDNSDRKKYVTSYGTVIIYDEDEKNFVKIRVPEEQVVGEVFITFGGSSIVLESVIVDMEDYLDEVQELERQGFEIVEVKNISSNMVILDEDGSYVSRIVFDDEVSNIRNKIIVGGPAVNRAAAKILGLDFPTYGVDTELRDGESVIRYYDDLNSVVVYGYEYEDTLFVVNKFLEGDDRGDEAFFDTR